MKAVCVCVCGKGIPDVDIVTWSSHSLFRIHFDKLKKIPVLHLDASVEFQSHPAVQEQFISKVFTTAIPGTATGGHLYGLALLS